MTKKVFISFASKDAKVAQSVCAALESRGHVCWMSSRDVAPGENYQGAIVRAIRSSGMMVMVFSANANNSDEIKKELALASQAKVMVVPVRAEDVIPGEDFTYELATRQWIDLFGDWDQAMDRIGRQIETIIPRMPVMGGAAYHGEDGKSGAETESAATPVSAPVPHKAQRRRLPLMLGGGLVAVFLAVAAVWMTRPAPPPVMHTADRAPQMELALWDAVKDSGGDEALNSYLRKYPQGTFADAARARLASLHRTAAATPAKPAPEKTPPEKAAPEKTTVKTVARALPATMTMAAPLAIPASMPVPAKPDARPASGKLDSNVAAAVDVARASEKRARDAAAEAEQAAGMAETGAPGYGVVQGNGPRWSGRFGQQGHEGPGMGVVTYANGDRYAGQTRQGRRDGVGGYTGAPERIFKERVGDFADQLNGYAVVYRRDGKVRIGHWKNSSLDGYGAVYDGQGKLLEQGLYANDTLQTVLTGN